MQRAWIQILPILVVLEIAAISKPVRYTDVCELARQSAAQPYQAITNGLSEELAGLSYDQMRAIKFRREKALWGKEQLPFKIEFFHPGGLHRDIVTIYQIGNDATTEVPFAANLFSYGTNPIPKTTIPGFSGFRVLTREKSREIAAFQDASYFRMVGLGQTYGTSARGLALNTTQLAQEEFPAFRQFWLRKPNSRDEQITIYALMDSPSVVGAFQFAIQGGKNMFATVNATFYPRREIAEFGIAPLTSMFWFDENSREPLQDFRPEVHDADGLLVKTSKSEWLWRPFEAGKMARFNAYSDKQPRGFGVLQRDRQFDHYFDLVAQYHKRPSVWVKPVGDWGSGAIKLIQLTTQSEFADNIVVYWVPAKPPKPGESLAVSYELEWTTNRITPESLGQVGYTRMGRVDEKEFANLRFVIEFEGSSLKKFKDTDEIKAIIGGDVKAVTYGVIKNDVTGNLRLAFEILPPKTATDLSACLTYQGRLITENWTYTWQP